MGVIMTDGGNMFLQPLPDNLVQSRGNAHNHTHIIYKRTTDQRPPSTFECGVQGQIVQIVPLKLQTKKIHLHFQGLYHP